MRSRANRSGRERPSRRGVFRRSPYSRMVLGVALAVVAVDARAANRDEEAQQAFRAGVDAARQERWNDALAAFQKAYELSPRPVVLINLASIQVRTGHLLQAAANYRRLLSDAPSADTAAFRRAATDVLPSLEARIPKIRLRSTGLSQTDTIQVDGHPVAKEALATGHPLDPGEHILIVQRDGIERARVLFALVERDVRDIRLPLPALSAVPASPSQATAAGPSSMPEGISLPPRRKRTFWASPWTWSVLAAVVVGLSVTSFVLWGGRDEIVSGNVPPRTACRPLNPRPEGSGGRSPWTAAW